MSEDYKHLAITKEDLRNDRRTRKIYIPQVSRDDIRTHSRRLSSGLTKAIEHNKLGPREVSGGYVLKLRYSGNLDFSHLGKHGVEFVSNEGSEVCIVFGTEQGMATFAEHLERLGAGDTELTYKQILEALDGIEAWTADDRKSWAVRHKGFPKEEQFQLDVELWPVRVTHHPERIRLCNGFETWLTDRGASFIDRINLDSLVMYRVFVDKEQADELLEHPDVRYVDLIPVTGINYQQLDRDINEFEGGIPSPDEAAAKVCILDSGINTNHPLLAAAIAEGLSFVDGEDESDLSGHGTSVASVALYGDLDACNSGSYWVPKLWLYNGKILDSNAEFDQGTILTKITEAVQYFSGLGCRIFNLSIGNQNAPYDGTHVRGIAYVLDSLAREYDVLFVVSSGNFVGSEYPPVPVESWRDEYPDYLVADESVIIDPAPALNVVTVGSLAQHNSSVESQRHDEIIHLAPASENQPSPFTRHGPSVKGAIKPDLVATGGNLASPMRELGKQWRAHMRGLGVLTCNHGYVGGTLLKEVSGTSFAAPYITHLAARILTDYPAVSANMLRALLVNNSDVPREVGTTFSDEMKEAYLGQHRRDVVRDLAGYGVVDEDILYRSSENAVVLMAEERIENDSHQFFELPLPEEFLRSSLATRELRVTLAHSPAVRTTRLDYVATKINYCLVQGDSLADVQEHFNHDTQDTTATRCDDAISNRTVTSQLRGKGTVQSSIWRFRRRKPSEKWFVVVTRQDRDWGRDLSHELEPYALVVSVHDRENDVAQLYTQISQRIQEKELVRGLI